jgi:putative ABC transport system substrate-binding protein
MLKQSKLHFFIFLLAALLRVFSCTHIYSKNPPERIILLETFDVPVILEHTKYFQEAMKSLGYNASDITILKAQGDKNKAEKLLKEAIENKKPNVIVASATLAAQVALEIGNAEKIPVVFFVVSDPVGAGLVKYLDVPTGGNITGIVHSVPRSTKIEIVMRILEPVKPINRPIRFGYIYQNYPSAIGDLNMLNEAAKKRGDVEFVSHQIPYDNQFLKNTKLLTTQMTAGINALESKIDYWWISQGPIEDYIKPIIQYSKHPVACGTNFENMKDGALVHITADARTGAYETANCVDQILKGKFVGSITVHSPTKIDFGINLETAKKIGVAIPSDLILLAGTNILNKGFNTK